MKIEIAFAADGDKIRLPIAEFLLCAAAGNLTRSKKQRDWTLHNAVLLRPFLTEAAILRGESDAGELLNISARFITEWAKEEETRSEADEANDEDSVISIEAKDVKLAKPGKAKQATAETLTPSQRIATTSWPSSRPFPSNIHESLRLHSHFTRTSTRASGSNTGHTLTSPHRPSRPHKTTWVSRAS